jgi:hypothetical protein
VQTRGKGKGDLVTQKLTFHQKKLLPLLVTKLSKPKLYKEYPVIPLRPPPLQVVDAGIRSDRY